VTTSRISNEKKYWDFQSLFRLDNITKSVDYTCLVGNQVVIYSKYEKYEKYEKYDNMKNMTI
jgi:hypothetical protein